MNYVKGFIDKRVKVLNNRGKMEKLINLLVENGFIQSEKEFNVYVLPANKLNGLGAFFKVKFTEHFVTLYCKLQGQNGEWRLEEKVDISVSYDYDEIGSILVDTIEHIINKSNFLV